MADLRDQILLNEVLKPWITILHQVSRAKILGLYISVVQFEDIFNPLLANSTS